VTNPLPAVADYLRRLGFAGDGTLAFSLVPTSR